MSELYVYYEESSTGGDYRGQFKKRPDSHTEFKVEAVTLEETSKYFKEVVNVDWPVQRGDRVFVLVVRYTTGGSFCTEYGKWTIFDIYKTEDDLFTARDLLIEENEKYQSSVGKLPGWEGEHREWMGYFESLEGFDVYDVIIHNPEFKTDGKKHPTRQFKLN